jgi:enoyl-CoA hydratase/carnithine racemase
MNDLLDINRGGDCWTFTLNRTAKMNALSAEMVEALIQGIEDAHASAARTLAFVGAGRNFCAGFDFSDIGTQSEGDLLLRFVRIETLLRSIASSPCLTVAFAHGRNFGAGVDLFAVCKQRYSTPDASFRMPGLKFGLVLGSRRFCELVGRTAALDILQEARSIAAAEAQDIGLVLRMAQRDDWPALVADAQRIASALSVQAQKQLYKALDTDLADRDMADLVRSAARPGLKKRISDYLAER